MNDLIRRQDAIDAVDERIQTLLKDEVFRRKCGDRDLYGVKRLIQNIPSAPQWIPCSERLPEEDGFYLVSVGSSYKAVRVYEYKPCDRYENENLWKADGTYCFNWFVEAWMPLPQPWKEVEDEQVH